MFFIWTYALDHWPFTHLVNDCHELHCKVTHHVTAQAVLPLTRHRVPLLSPACPDRVAAFGASGSRAGPLTKGTVTHVVKNIVGSSEICDTKTQVYRGGR